VVICQKPGANYLNMLREMSPTPYQLLLNYNPIKTDGQFTCLVIAYPGCAGKETI